MGNELSSRKGFSKRPRKKPHDKRFKHDHHHPSTLKVAGKVSLSPTPVAFDRTDQASSKHASSGAVPVNLNDNSYLSVDGLGTAETSDSRVSSRSSHHHQCRSNTESPRASNDQVLPQTGTNGGLFTNASHFKIGSSIMGEHVEVHQHYRDTSMLEKMKAAHVAIEAEFDSSDREDAPKCHPGTRTRFLDELKDHIRLSTRITWLFGPAGVGKSAIMQTLAETLGPSVVCLSFFFSRPNRRDDPKRVFPTLAYRLATINDAYRQYLEDNLSRDPYFLAKNLDEQFRRLFIDPIVKQRIENIPSCVVILDGLDEADGVPAQRRILELIQGFVERDGTSSVPISWIIASRPEPHLQTSFSRIMARVPDKLWKLEIPIDSDEAAQEVELYIRAAFSKIREEFADVVPAHWPPEADLLKITTTSSGLFVFGSTCMGYIEGQNPVQRLKHIVALIDHYRAETANARPELPRNPFEILDILYRAILDGIPSDTLSMTRAILGFHLLDPTVTGLPSFVTACKILEFERSDAYAALRALHSVLRLPPPEDHEAPLKFLHASFSDFFRDRSRSKEHWIDMTKEIRTVWRCYVRVFRVFLETTYPELILLDEDECDRRIEADSVLAHQSDHSWLRILITHCHSLPCSCGIPNHLILDTEELLAVFKEFLSVLFCPELLFNYPEVPDVIAWLFNAAKSAPTAFLKRVYLQTMTLNDFTEYNYDCIFEGLELGRSASYNDGTLCRLDTSDASATEWEEIKREPATINWDGDELVLQRDWRLLGDLMHLGKERQAELTVKIFGIREDGLWVLISGNFQIDGSKVEDLIFPYLERVEDSQ